ncbi:hypothetical protein YC2023_039277 [Brassica napus]
MFSVLETLPLHHHQFLIAFFSHGILISHCSHFRKFRAASTAPGAPLILHMHIAAAVNEALKRFRYESWKTVLFWWTWNPATSRLSSSEKFTLSPSKRNQTQEMPHPKMQKYTPIITSERLVRVSSFPYYE